MKFQQLMVVWLCVLLFSGCTSMPGRDEIIGAEPSDEPVDIEVESFPAWNSTDHDGQFMSDSGLSGGAYMAYFSAPWCTHCEPTLDAYNSVIPSDRMMIFSIEDDEEYSNMSDWHSRMESKLNTTLNQSFMLMPELAYSIGVRSIPHAVYVNEQGFVYDVEIGKRTNLTEIQSIWDKTSVAMFNSTTGWSDEI